MLTDYDPRELETYSCLNQKFYIEIGQFTLKIEEDISDWNIGDNLELYDFDKEAYPYLMCGKITKLFPNNEVEIEVTSVFNTGYLENFCVTWIHPDRLDPWENERYCFCDGCREMRKSCMSITYEDLLKYSTPINCVEDAIK